MPNRYETLDKQIVAAIKAKPRCNPARVAYFCWAEVVRLAEARGRDRFRIIDGRLQALRKKGVIEYVPTDGNKRAGWVVKEARNG